MLTKDDWYSGAIDEMAGEVRDRLGLDYWDFEYKVVDGKYSGTCQCDFENLTAVIEWHEPFFEGSYEDQIMTIIHEHVHVLLWGMCEFTTGAIETGELGDEWRKVADDWEETMTRDITNIVYGDLYWRLLEVYVSFKTENQTELCGA